jgi:CheY-like chemotaxis protein
MGAERLLIVDDESTILVLLRTLFEHRGVSVKTAESGAEALEAMRAEHFSVLLVDKQMPLMTGLDLIARTRQEWPDMSVVLMTAYPEALPPELRLDGYLAKPFKSLAEVENVVNNAFQARLRRQQLAQLEQTMARMRVR